MAEEGLSGKTLTLKLKTTAFEVRTRAYTLAQHIHTAEDIRNVALRLLQAELPVEIRLMVRSWLAHSSVNTIGPRQQRCDLRTARTAASSSCGGCFAAVCKSCSLGDC